MARRKEAPKAVVQPGRPATGLERQIGTGVGPTATSELARLQGQLADFTKRAVRPAQQARFEQVTAEAFQQQAAAPRDEVVRQEAQPGLLGFFDQKFVEQFNKVTTFVAKSRLMEEYDRALLKLADETRDNPEAYYQGVQKLNREFIQTAIKIDPSGKLAATFGEDAQVRTSAALVTRAQHEFEFRTKQLQSEARMELHAETARLSNYARSLFVLVGSGRLSRDEAIRLLSERTAAYRRQLNEYVEQRIISPEERDRRTVQVHDAAVDQLIKPLAQKYRETGQWDAYRNLADYIARGGAYEIDQLLPLVPDELRYGARQLITDYDTRTKATLKQDKLYNLFVGPSTLVDPRNVSKGVAGGQVIASVEEGLVYLESKAVFDALSPAERGKAGQAWLANIALLWLLGPVQDPQTGRLRNPTVGEISQRFQILTGDVPDQSGVPRGVSFNEMLLNLPEPLRKRAFQAAKARGLLDVVGRTPDGKPIYDIRITTSNLGEFGTILSENMPKLLTQAAQDGISDPTGTAVRLNMSQEDLALVGEVGDILAQDNPEVIRDRFGMLFDRFASIQAQDPNFADRPFNVPTDIRQLVGQTAVNDAMNGQPGLAFRKVVAVAQATYNFNPDPTAALQVVDEAIDTIDEKLSSGQVAEGSEEWRSLKVARTRLQVFRTLAPYDLMGRAGQLVINTGGAQISVSEMIEANIRQQEAGEKVVFAKPEDILDQYDLPYHVAAALLPVVSHGPPGYEHLLKNISDAVVTVEDEQGVRRAIAVLPPSVFVQREAGPTAEFLGSAYRRTFSVAYDGLVRWQSDTKFIDIAKARIAEQARGTLGDDAEVVGIIPPEISPSRIEFRAQYRDGKVQYILTNPLRDRTSVSAAAQVSGFNSAELPRPEQLVPIRLIVKRGAQTEERTGWVRIVLEPREPRADVPDADNAAELIDAGVMRLELIRVE